MLKFIICLFFLFCFGRIAKATDKICRLEAPCSVAYKTLGCYKDFGNNRVLPHYIYNERDSSIANYGGRLIDWYNWDKYIARFSCRCAERAQSLGYDLFGVQFYGECWAGKKSLHHSRLDVSGAKCLGDSYKTCEANDRYCAGEHYSNFVYEIVSTTCSVDFIKEGCYADNHHDNARPLANYVLNDRDPTDSSYSGQTIDWYNWDVYLPDLACRCAQKAKENGSIYFGLQFYVDTTCPVEFVKEGCYADNHNDNARPLANYVLNDRDPTDPSYSGQTIDWVNWDVYLPDLACRCAQKGECWTHPEGSETYGRDGHASNCINECYKDCKMHPFCSGVQHSNYVYRIREQETCDVAIQAMGCFVENPQSRVLRNEIVNAKDPSSDKFYGVVSYSDTWTNFFPNFLCKCAHEAKLNGQKYFGISDFGICYTDNLSENYAHLGGSSYCYEGSTSQACASGSMACAGSNDQSNYVYKITL